MVLMTTATVDKDIPNYIYYIIWKIDFFKWNVHEITTDVIHRKIAAHISVIGPALDAQYGQTQRNAARTKSQRQLYFWLKKTIKHSTCKLFIDEMW